MDTSALQKMLEDIGKGLGDTGDNLKQILITNEEAMRDYYEIIAKYSQDWIDSQLKQYRIEIDAKYSTVLTKQQIDNMYYAKERELQKEAYDYFQNIEGAFEIPPAPIASTGRNNLSSININNQQNELMMSIDGLKREIASSREQNFNLYLDGLPLRNAIKRVEKNLNIMGS